MSDYLCHECAIKKRILNNEIGDFDPSGTKYQLDKFYKHTVPPKCLDTVSIFDISENKKYKKYIVNTLASGCVEFDDQGRKNIVWIAGETQGYMFKNAVLQGDIDGVKVVLPDDPEKMHAFPTGSADLSTKKCMICGRKIIY